MYKLISIICLFFIQACIDIREAVVFWATMRTLTEMHTLPPELPWISTHPAHGDREKNLNQTMTKALELRRDSGVCHLSFVITVDSIVLLYKLSVII